LDLGGQATEKEQNFLLQNSKNLMRAILAAHFHHLAIWRITSNSEAISNKIGSVN